MQTQNTTLIQSRNEFFFIASHILETFEIHRLIFLVHTRFSIVDFLEFSFIESKPSFVQTF